MEGFINLILRQKRLIMRLKQEKWIRRESLLVTKLLDFSVERRA